MKKNKAISLIEVLVTVAILTGGIVFVFRGFMTSLSAANLSQNIMLASFLVEDKFWQIEEMQKQKILPENSGLETIKVQNREFNVKYEISRTGIEGLSKLNVSVSWPKDRKNSHSVDFVTYLTPEG
ncbi:MAG: hypothetical protein M0R48_01985 [Candidatus Omnitrophica bacterium]|jgi:type II secretory pathway pseudopilin PulG|nr:hypothetical protein [Candidatus Omnitrophota bacterium]